MAELQESDYGADRNYTHGSPHLSHPVLNDRIKRDLAALIRTQVDRSGQCRVLEIGAGHGTFTETLAAAGALVTVTEMSGASASFLARKFEMVDAVTVVHDPDGTRSADVARSGIDLIVFISVLHHIPDYVGVVTELVEKLPEGAGFYCVQDPTWYPTRSWTNRTADRGAYFVWRAFQGDVRRGALTRLRRIRGAYDDSNPSDMVEYHVVRQGVNEELLLDLLESRFHDVSLWTYWSTQSAVLQRLGERLGLISNFGIIARERRSAPNPTT